MPPQAKTSRKSPKIAGSADTKETLRTGRTLRKIGDYFGAADVSTSGRGGVRQRKAVSAERIGKANRAGAKKIGAEGPKPKPKNRQRNKFAR